MWHSPLNSEYLEQTDWTKPAVPVTDERSDRKPDCIDSLHPLSVARSKQKSRETAVQLVPRPEERPTDPPSSSARQITYNFPKRTLVNPTSAELQAAEEEYERSEERRRSQETPTKEDRAGREGC